jgi:hypothetical protein
VTLASLRHCETRDVIAFARLPAAPNAITCPATAGLMAIGALDYPVIGVASVEI